MVKEVFKERINELRRTLDVSAAAMAREAGILPSSMNFYLAGERCPDIVALHKICSTYGVSADWLLGLTDVRSSSEDVKTAVNKLGIDERFISKIKELDDGSRRHLFNMLDTPGFNDILLSEYKNLRMIQNIRVTTILENTGNEDEKNRVVGSGNVVLSKEEAVKFYAERVGHTLATILIENTDTIVSFVKQHNEMRGL